MPICQSGRAPCDWCGLAWDRTSPEVLSSVKRDGLNSEYCADVNSWTPLYGRKFTMSRDSFSPLRHSTRSGENQDQDSWPSSGYSHTRASESRMSRAICESQDLLGSRSARARPSARHFPRRRHTLAHQQRHNLRLPGFFKPWLDSQCRQIPSSKLGHYLLRIQHISKDWSGPRPSGSTILKWCWSFHALHRLHHYCCKVRIGRRT